MYYLSNGLELYSWASNFVLPSVSVIVDENVGVEEEAG